MTKIFRLFFPLLALGFSSCSNHQEPSPAEELIKGLSSYEMGALNLFFRTLLLETSVGYTLYGEKPVSDEGFRNENISINMSQNPMIEMGCILKLGARVWEESGLSKIKSNYEIHVSHTPYFGWRQMQFINVRSFLSDLPIPFAMQESRDYHRHIDLITSRNPNPESD